MAECRDRGQDPALLAAAASYFTVCRSRATGRAARMI